MGLSQNDLLEVNRIILQLYAVLEPQKQIETMLTVIKELVPNPLTAWNEFNYETRELTLVTLPRLDPLLHVRLEGAGKYAHQSPFPAHYAASGDGTWRMITDFIPIEDFARTDFAVKVLGEEYGPHQMGCVLTGFNATVRAITLQRGTEPFTERDRAVLNLLYPHLSLSHYNAHAFDRANRSIAELQAIVETAPAGYAYLSADGRVEWVTAKAKKLWGQFYAGEARNALDVPTTILNWLENRLRPNGSSDFNDAIERVLPGEELITRLLPAPLGGWTLAVEAHATAARPGWRDLAELSPRENEVMKLMTEGKRNGEIGIILGISARTVEKHVERIFAALRVENRASAIVTAMGMGAVG